VLAKKKKKSQSSFTMDEEKITKGLENLTFPTINFILTKASKPLLKGFVHQAELMVTILKGLPIKRVNRFDFNAYKLLVRVSYSYGEMSIN
jgi:hypothetical protein